MATAGRENVVIDSSVLVNFLRIDRCDLLGAHPHFLFLVTGHVRREITIPDQVTRLDAALAGGILQETTANAIDETALFAELTLRLGEGESAAIAAASKRGLRVALDDRTAKKVAALHCIAGHVLDTVDLMVSLIQAAVLDVAAADLIKADWEANHRFTLRFASFAEKV